MNRFKLKISGLLSNRIRDVREIWYRYHMNDYKSKWNIDLRDHNFMRMRIRIEIWLPWLPVPDSRISVTDPLVHKEHQNIDI